MRHEVLSTPYLQGLKFHFLDFVYEILYFISHTPLFFWRILYKRWHILEYQICFRHIASCISSLILHFTGTIWNMKLSFGSSNIELISFHTLYMFSIFFKVVQNCLSLHLIHDSHMNSASSCILINIHNNIVF